MKTKSEKFVEIVITACLASNTMLLAVIVAAYFGLFDSNAAKNSLIAPGGVLLMGIALCLVLQRPVRGKDKAQ